MILLNFNFLVCEERIYEKGIIIKVLFGFRKLIFNNHKAEHIHYLKGK